MSEHPADPAVEKATKELAAFDALLAELQAKFPDAEVESYTYSGGRLILRTPDEGACSLYMANRMDQTKQVQNVTRFARSGILWPDLALMDALFRRKPLLSQRIADKLAEKAGAAEEIALGK